MSETITSRRKGFSRRRVAGLPVGPPVSTPVCLIKTYYFRVKVSRIRTPTEERTNRGGGVLDPREPGKDRGGGPERDRDGEHGTFDGPLVWHVVLPYTLPSKLYWSKTVSFDTPEKIWRCVTRNLIDPYRGRNLRTPIHLSGQVGTKTGGRREPFLSWDNNPRPYHSMGPPTVWESDG